MHYQFREVGFEGKIIRFIKPFNFNSDGLSIAPVDALNDIAKRIEQDESDTVVVIMSGLGATLVSKSQTDRAEFMNRLRQSNQRLPDSYYDWDSAES